MTTLSPHRHAVRVRRIAAVGQTVNAAEALYKNDLYGNRSIMRGQAGVTKAPVATIHPELGRAVDSKAAATAINATNLVCGLTTLAFAERRRVRAVTAVVSVLAATVSRQRNPYGRDGSDQMQRVIGVYDAVSSVVPDESKADDLFLRAVNAQLAISYCASGLIKLVSDDWRSGRAMGLVMRTSMYGSPTLAKLIDAHPVIGKLLCWQTIAWETLYPVTYFVPMPVARQSLRFAKVFHASIGHFMGLPRFIWAFSATHPAAEYVITHRALKAAA